MDPREFEALSRRFARDLTRRGIVRAVGGMAALLLAPGGRAAASDVTSEGIPVFSCKIPGQKCKRSKQCCSNICKKKVCSCKPKGHSCYEPQEGGVCCSKICRDTKCQ